MGTTYAMGPGPGHRQLSEQRMLAESVPCPVCGAEAAVPCRSLYDGGPLVRQPAHTARLKAADAL